MTMDKAKQLILDRAKEIGWLEDKTNHHLKDVELSLITEDGVNRQHIHIILKKGEEYRMDFECDRDELDYISAAWNFIIFVDDKDVYVYPHEFLKRKDGNAWRMSKYMKDFKNVYTLLNMSELGLMSYLIDRKYQNG